MKLDARPSFNISDIDEAFDLITPINFHQNRFIKFGDKGGFYLEALNSGYSLGGAIWRFIFHSNKIVYAFDINDKNEKISMPVCFEDLTDSYLITNAYFKHPLKEKKESYGKLNEEVLLKHLENTIFKKIKIAI